MGMRPIGNTGNYSFHNLNLLENGEMTESDESAPNYGWTGQGTIVADSEFGNAMEVQGSFGTGGTVTQTIYPEETNQTYTFSAWAKGNSVALSDDSGELQTVTRTHTYTYGNSDWADLLTAYDGNPIIYDAIGNPTTWYDGAAMTWTNGRRLATISATNDHAALSFTYNSGGLRLTKTVGTEVHKYTWRGSKLIAEQYGDTELEFFYDESGAPNAFLVRDTSTATPTEAWYYYVTNFQGDVMQILDASGNVAASYSYNAWGKILNLNNSTSANIGDLNPIRYRGYYYDAETGLYYLKSRYYDPEICRFINADGLASTGQGFLGTNMFAYGLNGPVEDADSEGTSTRIVIEVVAGIVRDLYQIFRKDGNQVRVDDNGDGTLKIVNSSSVHTPIVQFGYSVYINLFNEHNHLIDGTSTGVFFEWIVHNVIYDMAMTIEQFGVKNASLDRIKESAHDADIGRTIFEGKRAGDKAMQLAYALSCPIQASIDYFISRIIQ